MTPGNAKVAVLGAMVVCSVVVFKRAKGFDPRREASIALLGALLLFSASFLPELAAIAAALLVVDALVLSGNSAGISAIDGIGSIAVPGASTSTNVTTTPLVTAVQNLFAGSGTTGTGTATTSTTTGSVPASPGELGHLEDGLKDLNHWLSETQKL
jgi:hypothetical protein